MEQNLVLTDVLYSDELSKNLLSLKRFVDQGLKIYLDNTVINIYEPKSKDNLITGIYLYKNPFWLVKLKIATKGQGEIEKQKMFALVNSSESSHTYNTRSKSTLEIFKITCQ